MPSTRRVVAVALILTGASATACGGSSSSTSDAGHDARVEAASDAGDAGVEAQVGPSGLGATFLVGAASAAITPPSLGATPPAEFAKCDLKTYDGPRKFAFDEPYTDAKGKGRYEDGDPYCDANKNGRYDGIFLAGGAGSDRLPTSIHDALGAQALVLGTADGKERIAVAVVDSIGLPAPIIEVIVKAAQKADPTLSQVFVSSTHDESAPDPLGLWGPTQFSSGVDDYYMAFLEAEVAAAIGKAGSAAEPAHLRFVEAEQPASFQVTFSSYPFVFDPTVMAMQAVAAKDGTTVLFTLANYNFHAEGYGYSPVAALTVAVSADWPGALRSALEAKYGGVGIGMAGLVGSVETPHVYPGAAVADTPIPTIDAGSGNYTIFPDPKATELSPGTPAETDGIGEAVAGAVVDAFTKTPGQWSSSGVVRAAVAPYCAKVENTQFLLAAKIGLIARDATCKGKSAQTPSQVELLDLGDAQVVYLPGEVFPFTVLRSFLGASDMPFPSEPMTPWLASAMTGRFPFYAGLGGDMLGYLMPPGDFVGDPGEVDMNPWATWDKTHTNDDDRFGWIHNDDSESLGPSAALEMSSAALAALRSLDPAGPPRTTVATGRFVDAEGRIARSPFPGAGFSGAVGVWVLPAGKTDFTPGTGSIYTVAGHPKVGSMAATATAGGFLDLRGQPRTDGYGISTRGIWLPASKAAGDVERVFVDVYPGK